MSSNPRRAIATISTPNYWPYTAVLIESLRKVFPGWDIHVLGLTDFPAGTIPGDVHFISARDIWGDLAEDCRRRFNLFEWACASKPRLMRHVLQASGAGLAVYADSDIEFFAQPDCVLGDAGESIILQPNVASLAECASREWERLHLQYGSFNGGFFAVRPTDETDQFLQWWDDRVTRYCCAEPALDIFSDQRWLDLVPGLFSGVYVDRDPCCNVAIWNFAGRRLRQEGSAYRVGDRPLSFFHYHRVRLGMDVEGYVESANHDAAVSALVRSYLERAARHATPALMATPRYDMEGGSAVPALFFRAVRDTEAEGPMSDYARGRRQQARMRVLAYHWPHVLKVSAPEPDIDRYQRSAVFRAWVDLWFFVMAPARVGIPVRFVARSPAVRAFRSVLGRCARFVLAK